MARGGLSEERGGEKTEAECKSARTHSRRYAVERGRFRDERSRQLSVGARA
jgi:hypothetical protein